ncbi:MAG: hypothetical protein LAO78_24000 [Acidobacteriia bacterium]|nr:hypothetical protein [Terriglobia bacterium]
MSQEITKKEVLKTITELAEKLGRAPTLPELENMSRVKRRHVREHFTNMTNALRACGMGAPKAGVRIATGLLFEDWATVARKLRQLPGIKTFRKMGKHSAEALLRLCGHWSAVPRTMHDYATKNGLEKKWKDVMEMMAEQPENDWPTDGRKWPGPKARRSLLKKDRLVYGPLMSPAALLHVPLNEMGVMFLFATMALEMGFMATMVRTAFPDCEALREVSPGRLQRVRIEFEYLSRNFLKHKHRIDGCDLIVCWINNWPDCPLEVLELSKIVGNRKRQNLTAD